MLPRDGNGPHIAKKKKPAIAMSAALAPARTPALTSTMPSDGLFGKLNAPVPCGGGSAMDG